MCIVYMPACTNSWKTGPRALVTPWLQGGGGQDMGNSQNIILYYIIQLIILHETAYPIIFITVYHIVL